MWHELDSLGKIAVGTRGNLAIIGNSGDLVASMLDRSGSNSTAAATYVAMFRSAGEQANYEHLMRMLDQTRRSGFMAGNAQPFFSANLAGVGRVLARVRAASVTSTDTGGVVVQTALYEF